jgi:hypothetical protein
MSGDELTAWLTVLHEEYVTKVNAAIAGDREDLIPELAEEWAEEALLAFRDAA